MAAHTYWRLNVAAADGGSTLTLAEIELHTSVGGANVATGGTASASSGTAANAFDANNATNWALASGTVGWIQYLFGSAQDIVEHAITAPSATMTNAPKHWSLQYSDDGSNWTSATFVGGQTGWTSNEKRTFTHSSYPTAIGNAPLRAAVMACNSTSLATASVRAVLRADAALQTAPMISGTVKENGANVARTVRAYCRLTGEVLGETVSNASTGAFSINARGRTDHAYVIALDDLTGGQDYNASIYDLVIPV